jgi:hypothetical protein
VSRFTTAVVLLLALLPAALGDSFQATTTITSLNMTNQSTDSFFADNASAITEASFTAKFSRFGDFPTERRGFLYRNSGDWNSGTLDNATVEGNTVKFDSAGALDGDQIESFDPATDIGYSNPGGFVQNTSVKMEGNASRRQTDSNYHSKVYGDTHPTRVDVWYLATNIPSQGYVIGLTNGGVDGSDFAQRGPTVTIKSNLAIQECFSAADRATLTAGRWYRVSMRNINWAAGGTFDIYLNDSLVGAGFQCTSQPKMTRVVFGVSAALDYNVDDLRYNCTSPCMGSIIANGSWTSPVQDAGTLPLGQTGQRYSQIQYNLTVPGANTTGSINIRASDNLSALTGDAVAWTIVREFNSTSNSSCPCSTGTNLSGVVGRYSQVRYNVTPNGDIQKVTVNDTQLVLAADDSGTLRLNSADYSFVQGVPVTVLPASFQSGLNTIRMVVANNTSYWDVNLSFTQASGVAIETSKKTCYTWKNVTAFLNADRVTLAFDKPSVSFTGGWNVTAYLNGTRYDSNRTRSGNNTSSGVAVWEDASTVYAQFNNTTTTGYAHNNTVVQTSDTVLRNGSKWNVLADFVCLNATAKNEDTGAAITAFTVRPISGSAKSTTTGYVWFNGTEIPAGGGTNLTWRVTATGFGERDFVLNQPNDGINRTFPLVADTVGAFITFVVTDRAGAAIFGASVLAVNSITGDLVGSGLTDSTGSVRFFLNPSTTYTITFSAAGFNTLVSTIQPTQSVITVRLGSGDQFLQNDLTQFNVTWLPVENTINRTNASTITLAARSGNCGLTGLNLTATVGGSNFTNNSTAPCDARITLTLNLTGVAEGGAIAAVGRATYLTVTGESVNWSESRTFTVRTLNASKYSVHGLITGGSPGLFGPQSIFGAFGSSFVALAIAFFATLIVAARAPLGTVGSGAVFVLIGGIFIISGMLDTATFAVAAMAAVGAILLRRGLL